MTKKMPGRLLYNSSGEPIDENNPLPVRQLGSVLEEQKTQADAEANVITFSKELYAVDIYHAEATSQLFVVNGLTLTVPPGGYRTNIGGTIGKTISVPAGIDCIIGRLS